jgi:hypothetical protein
MNKQYEQLQVAKGEYIPQPALDYPQENPFERTLFPVFDRELAIDENYPYIDDSPKSRFLIRLAYLFILKIYATDRGWTDTEIEEACEVKRKHDRRWVRRKRITHMFRKKK